MGVDDSPISLRTRKVTVMPYPSNLELSVANFGPIAKADIDLRPLTVFVGPSNTGKSYLAILIYALHRFFSGDGTGRFRERRLYGYRGELDPLLEQGMTPERIKSLAGWVGKVTARVEEAPGDDLETLSFQLPDFVMPMLRPYIEEVSDLADQLDSEVARCFGVDNTADLVRHRSRGGAQVSLKRRPLGSYGQIESAEYGFTAKKAGSKFVVSIPNEMPLYAEGIDKITLDQLMTVFIHRGYTLDESANSDEKIWATSHLLTELAGMAENRILNPLNRVAHYLPADRTGIMHAHRVAVGSLIARAPYAGLQRDDPLPVLSGVLADFLGRLSVLGEQAVHISPPSIRPTRGRRSNGNMLASRLEEEVLRGSVHNRRTVTGYPVFSFQPEGWQDDLPLMNASSMVSELAPVVLYLRHVVSPGEVLIIEEPESHLHPAMQVEFIRHLAAAVRSGVRIMITTHSEWVLDELANLVRMSELPKTHRKGIGGADYSISPEQLGVWLFEPKQRPRGSVVKEIPFDEDFGGFRSGFDEVAIGTYNDYAAISNRVEQGRAE